MDGHAQQLRKNPLPSIEWLRENLRYVPETGELWWIREGSKRSLYTPAGGITNGRVYVGSGLGKHNIARSRAAFAIMEGRWPECVDHINGNKLDDRWENLREVNHSENSKNQKTPKSNTSGVCGVSWDSFRGKWKAQIVVNRRCITLGRSSDFFEAVCARKSAELHYGFHENHGR